MKITIINKENEEFFLSFMDNIMYKDNENILRLGALEDDNEVAGAMVVQTSETGADILSLFVRPEYRRNGYGRELVNTLFSLARGTDQNRIQVHFPMDETAMAFFYDMGFELVSDMSLKYVRLGSALNSPVCQKNVLKAKSDNVKLISELDSAEKNAFANYMKSKGFWETGYYTPEFSSVCLSKDTVTSIMLTQAGDGNASILWLDFNPSCQKELLSHLGVLLRHMQSDERFGDNSKIYFAVENEKFVDILSKLSLDLGMVKKESEYVLGAKVIV